MSLSYLAFYQMVSVELQMPQQLSGENSSICTTGRLEVGIHGATYGNSQHTMDFTMMFRKKWAVCHGPAQLLCLGLLQLSVPQSPGPSGMSLHGSCTRNL